MKLAEALSLRKDLEKRISGLKDRLENVARIQEDEEPSENPEELMTELDRCLKQQEQLIFSINITNMKIVSEDGKIMTKLLAERDVLNKRISILRNTFDHASGSANRYCRNEIRMVSTIDVKPLRQKLDKYSQQYRLLDMQIQSLNFANDLIE
jgi:hypothetical protein